MNPDVDIRGMRQTGDIMFVSDCKLRIIIDLAADAYYSLIHFLPSNQFEQLTVTIRNLLYTRGYVDGIAFDPKRLPAKIFFSRPSQHRPPVGHHLRWGDPNGTHGPEKRKRDSDENPISLCLLTCCRRRDLNPHGSPHHPET
jgi:hypothetical protein